MSGETMGNMTCYVEGETEAGKVAWQVVTHPLTGLVCTPGCDNLLGGLFLRDLVSPRGLKSCGPSGVPG